MATGLEALWVLVTVGGLALRDLATRAIPKDCSTAQVSAWGLMSVGLLGVLMMAQGGAAIEVRINAEDAERALELMCKRLSSRVAFGREVARQTVWQERVAEARCMIEQARLLTLKAAYMMDTVGNKVAKAEIAMIKVVAPNMACQVIDWAMQAHGGGGMCDDFPLAYAYAQARTLRFADGPDEVHHMVVGRAEMSRH